jgi:hypothetical protein
MEHGGAAVRRIVRVSSALALLLVFAAGARGATKRALLIGINHYAPSAEDSAALKKIEAEPHKADSRFAPGYEWPDLRGPLNDIESMHLLLRDTYGFPDSNITMLKDRDATRDAILKALDDLIASTQPGDEVVFFFAGHGSQRLNSSAGLNTAASGKEEGRDETIVPADAFRGTFDIRDKELAQRFNRILDEKKARLVAIFDSCHSGTMARGAQVNATPRLLEYDDRDIASDPTAYKGNDLKHAPKDGNAIIVTASLANESAQESEFSDDHLVHGVFTRSLISVLKNANANWSAVDVINSVQYVMKVDNPIPQQPTVEGRVNDSLFGDHGPTSLHASVISAQGGEVQLNIGSIAGFDVGTKFTSVANTGAKSTANNASKASVSGPAPTVLEVTSVDGPAQATAKVISGDSEIVPGALFAITEMHPREDAKLRIFLPSSDWDPAIAPAQQAKTEFTGFEWVKDPATESVQYYVTRSKGQWRAFDAGGAEITAAAAKALAAQGKPRKAFLALPPPAKMVASLESLPGFKNRVFEFTPDLDGTQYMLIGHEGVSGREYALLRSDFMGPRPATGYIESAISKNSANTVVCGQDRSLPVRTEWVQDRMLPARTEQVQSGEDGRSEPNADAAEQIQAIAGRLAKLRGWMSLQTDAQPSGFWPYHLTVEARVAGNAQAQVVTPTSILTPQTAYDLSLQANPDDLTTQSVQPLFAYVIGFDCSAHSYLLYPSIGANGGAPQPAHKADGTYPARVLLASEKVSAPFGADSLFLLVTPDKITDLGVFSFDGVIDHSSGARGIGSKLGNMLQGLGDYGSRGIDSSSDQWTLQSVIIPSKAPGN